MTFSLIAGRTSITAPTSTSSAMPMIPTPMRPHWVEVATATRKVCEADLPRAAARTVVT